MNPARPSMNPARPSIYDLVDPVTAEVRPRPPAAGVRVATPLDGMGCGEHRWKRESPGLVLCTRCPTSLARGQIHYGAVDAALEG